MDQVLREIGALRNLRQLALNGLTESADLSFLPSLSKLSAVDFYHSTLSAAGLRSIGQCPRLKVVSLYMAVPIAGGRQSLLQIRRGAVTPLVTGGSQRTASVNASRYVNRSSNRPEDAAPAEWGAVSAET